MYSTQYRHFNIVQVPLTLPPPSIDHNTNVSRFINQFYLLLIIICFNNVSLQTVGVLSLFSGKPNYLLITTGMIPKLKLHLLLFWLFIFKKT